MSTVSDSYNDTFHLKSTLQALRQDIQQHPYKTLGTLAGSGIAYHFLKDSPLIATITAVMGTYLYLQTFQDSEIWDALKEGHVWSVLSLLNNPKHDSIHLLGIVLLPLFYGCFKGAPLITTIGFIAGTYFIHTNCQPRQLVDSSPVKTSEAKTKQWMQDFKNSLSATESLIEVYKDTVNATKNGWECCSQQGSRFVSLNSHLTELMISNTQEVGKLYPSLLQGERPAIRVEKNNLVDVALQLKAKGKNPVLLNLGDAYIPGFVPPLFVVGTFPEHEGELFRRSNIHLALHQPRLVSREKNVAKYIRPIGVIYSPHVQFFRQNRSLGYAFFDGIRLPIQDIAVITYGAFSQGKMIESLAPKNDAEKAKEIIRYIFRTAIQKGHDSIVLENFGCESIFEDPDLEVGFFKAVLQEPEFFQGEGTGALKEIVFAIEENSLHIRSYRALNDAFNQCIIA